jgi:hypothetical protein
VVEVLSDSTGSDHHVRKLERDKARDTLRQYVVFAQRAPVAHVWLKGDAGWPAQPTRHEGIGDAVAFAPVGASVSLAEVYGAPEPDRRTA